MKKATDIDIQGLDELFEKYRKSPDSYVFVLLADACRKLERIEEALDICSKGIERHPRYASGYVVKGKCHYDLEDHDTARSAFEKVLTLDQNNLVALKYLGMIEADRGNYDSASGYFEHILRLDPDNKSIKETLRVMEEHRQMSSDAAAPTASPGARPGDEASGSMAAAGAAAEVETSDELATLTLADIFASQGYQDKAIKICEELLKKNPRNRVVRDKLKSLGGTPVEDAASAAHDPAGPAAKREGMQAPADPGAGADDPSAIDLGGGTNDPHAVDLGDGTDDPHAVDLGGTDDPYAIELSGETDDPGGGPAPARARVIELGGGEAGQVEPAAPVPAPAGHTTDGRDPAPADDDTDGRDTVELTGPVDDGGAILLPQDSIDIEASRPVATPAEPEPAASAGPPRAEAGDGMTDAAAGFTEIDSETTGPQGRAAPQASDEWREAQGGESAPPQNARRAIDEKESMNYFRRWLRQMKD